MIYWLLFYSLMPFYSLLTMDNRVHYNTTYANSWFEVLKADLDRISKTIDTIKKYPHEWIDDEKINEEAVELVTTVTNSEKFKAFITEPNNDHYTAYRKQCLQTIHEQGLLRSTIAGVPLTSTDPKLEHELKVICCADLQLRKKLRHHETKKS